MDVPPEQQIDRDRTWRRSERRVDRYYTSPHATIALLSSFVGMHLLTGLEDWASGRTSALGVLFGERSTEVLVLFGGRQHDLVAQGQVWRLLTCGFLHADLMHIGMNALAFWGLGRMCEAVFGSARLLALFCTAVVGGAILSQAGGGPLSIGASGGVFGLMGALVAFGWRRRRSMGPEMRAMFGRQLYPWILLNLGIGFALPFIDNLGHIGGLLTGLVLGLLLKERITGR